MEQPNLSLDLNPAKRQMISRDASGAITHGLPTSVRAPRTQSAKFTKNHNFAQKDVYRVMKADKIISKHAEKKKSCEMGRAGNKTLLEIKNARYKQIGEVISEQYSRSQLPEARHYMIDKVVRMRGQHGRFGIDHSELLNYELE